MDILEWMFGWLIDEPAKPTKPTAPSVKKVEPEIRDNYLGATYFRMLAPKYYGLSGCSVTYVKLETWETHYGGYFQKEYWNGKCRWDYHGPRKGRFIRITEEEYEEAVCGMK